MEFQPSPKGRPVAALGILRDSLNELFALPWRHRAMIWQMVRRDVVGKFQGSILGLGWILLQPLIMLVVYMFVFTQVFTMRWATDTAGTAGADFTTSMFIGLILHGFVAESSARAPNLVVGNANYVKKVVFPLEILAWTTLGTALISAAASLLVWAALFLLLNGYLHWTLVLLPVVLLPLCLVVLGGIWLLASLGVYVRDLAPIVGLAMTVLLFVSPILYPVSAVPAAFRPWMHLNPLTAVIEQVRDVAIHGLLIDPWTWMWSLGFGLIVAVLGLTWFRLTRRGFADVL